MRVAGEMDLCHPFRWNAVYIFQRIEAMISRREENVVYVEKDAAVDLLDYFNQ